MNAECLFRVTPRRRLPMPHAMAGCNERRQKRDACPSQRATARDGQRTPNLASEDKGCSRGNGRRPNASTDEEEQVGVPPRLAVGLARPRSLRRGATTRPPFVAAFAAGRPRAREHAPELGLRQLKLDDQHDETEERELWPSHLREDSDASRCLPEKKIRQPLLAGGANQQVHRRHLRVRSAHRPLESSRSHNIWQDIRPFALNSQLPHRRCHLKTRCVRKADSEHRICMMRGRLHDTLHVRANARRKAPEISSNANAHPTLLNDVVLRAHGLELLGAKVHESLHLCRRSLEVLNRKSINSYRLHAKLIAPPHCAL
mmetsp:Transcript_4690/g.10190  ORF Transcript_4690/g.10190 Transcript_4690/m.10190 type:complete len:316 (+) Transcript_4690:459-1406(+)